ncbi:MAG: hypothetical protein GY898_29370 [Proteobacteria bacterium]|nr:hypothetical protein [Pseudomonadota bacterium]
MLSPKSVPARPPVFDREVLRAAAFGGRSGSWPRTFGELAAQVAEHFGRDDGRWVAEPEAALLRVVLDRLPAGGPAGPPIAAPAFGPPGFAEVLGRFHQVHWMEPARGRIDPGPSEVAEALDAGAQAVLLAPIAGDGTSLPDAARLCQARGALLLVDARACVGTRILDGGPERFGDLVLLPPDGEPSAGVCAGAILCGDGTASEADKPGPLGLRKAVAAVAESLRDEPRLRRWFSLAAPQVHRPRAIGKPPAWAVAAAGARLRQARFRADQRARHAQVMRINFGNLPAVEMVTDPTGFQSAGAALPLLAQGRDEVVSALAEQGVPTRGDLAGWLAPEGARGPRALDVADRALLVPLHPFYRPADIEAIGERLRRATLRINGTGWTDPTRGEPEPTGH